ACAPEERMDVVHAKGSSAGPIDAAGCPAGHRPHGTKQRVPVQRFTEYRTTPGLEDAEDLLREPVALQVVEHLVPEDVVEGLAPKSQSIPRHDAKPYVPLHAVDRRPAPASDDGVVRD